MAALVLSGLCVVLALILAALIGLTVYAEHLLSSIKRTENGSCPTCGTAILPPEDSRAPDDTGPVLDPTEVTLDTATENILEGRNMVNILLIGQDRRANEGKRARADAMILCSFSRQNNTVTLTSFMRDLYVELPGRGGDKLNAAYAYGGMPLLKDTLLVNFGVSVDACVEVDFSGFQQVIDVMGGVDIALSAKEAAYMKKTFGWDMREGGNHMDGSMALAYSRIRAIGNDFGRTERQRKVLTQLLEKSRSMDLGQTLALLEQTLPLLTTDMTNGRMLGYVKALLPMIGTCQIRTLRIPAEGTYRDAWVGEQAVLVPDLKANRALLAKELNEA